MDEKETCPTALMFRLQYEEWKRDKEETTKRELAAYEGLKRSLDEFTKVFGKIPGQSKEGK